MPSPTTHCAASSSFASRRDRFASAAICTALLAGTCIPTSTAAADDGFTPLPFLNQIASAEGLSGDGTTVVGWYRTGSSFLSPLMAFRWSAASGYNFLSPLPNREDSIARSTSFNGAITTGNSDGIGTNWFAANNGAASNPGIGSSIIDISGNGAVQVTSFSFNAGSGWLTPAAPPSPLISPAFTRLSHDGAFIAGTVQRRIQTGSGYGSPTFTNFNRMSVYSRLTGSYSVVDPLPGYEHAQALSISANGRVSVGNCTDFESILPPIAIRSTDGAPAVTLGTLAPGSDSSAADVSADGAAIVGSSASEAFVWTAPLGMRSIRSSLVANGFDLDGWTLTAATAISDAGQIVMGNAIDPQGRSRQWVANLTAVCTPVPPTITTTATVLAQQGQSDGAGGTFGASGAFSTDSFTQATIEPSGSVAFTANRTDGRSGLYFADSNPIVPVLTPVSVGGLIGPYTGIVAPVLRSPTSIAFVSNEQGMIASGNPRGTITTRFSAGQSAPETGLGTFSGLFPFSNVLLSAGGTLGFQASITGGTTGFAAYKFSGGTATRQTFASPTVSSPRTLSLTDAGVLLRDGFDDATTSSILAFGQGPSLPIRLVTGATLSNSPLTVTSLLGNLPAIAGEHVVHLVRLSDNRLGLVHISATGVRTLMVASGDPTSAAPGAPALASPSSAFTVTPSGTVYLVGNTDQATSAGIFSVRVASPRVLSPVVVRGDKLPAATCRIISAISPSLSSSGERLLFGVSLGIVGEPSTKSAVALYDPTAGIVPLLTTGDTVEVAPGITGTVASVQVPALSNTSGDDGRPSAISPSGAAALSAVVIVSGTPRQTLIRVQANLPNPSAACSIADLDTTGDGPDGIVDGSDFVAFINSFSAGDVNIDPLADIAGAGDTGLLPDGTIDGNDFIAFINAFAVGC